MDSVGREFPIIDPDKAEELGKNYKNSGWLHVEEVAVMFNTTPGIVAHKRPRLSEKTKCLARIKIEGKELDKMDWVGLSDPYLVLPFSSPLRSSTRLAV